MKYRILFISFLCILIGTIVVFSFINAPPHKFNFMEGECLGCHINFKEPRLLKKEINDICNECHGSDDAVSHLVGMKASMTVPPEFRLNEYGEITCNTCHDIHMESIDPATGGRNYLLRVRERGEVFCNRCHQDTFGKLMEGTIFKGHLGYDLKVSGTNIDKISLFCLSCHDGGIAKEAPFNAETGHGGAGNHPIGMEYIASLRKGKRLLEPDLLPANIKLIDGKVGCVSCHNPYEKREHRLALSNTNSKLCMICHTI